LSTEYEEYIATSEDFKIFCNEVLDLEVDSDYDNFILKRYVRAKKKVKFIAETFNEGRTIQGFRRLVDTKKGPVKIGFTRFREHRIYVQAGEIYLRAYRVFLADLCTDNAWGFEPLNKFDNGGNIEIIEWNKRPCRKGIIYINNKLQNILYIIDAYFEEDGKLILVDYKTDRNADEAELAERYRPQQEAYAQALEKLYGRPVAEMYLYSFWLGKNK